RNFAGSAAMRMPILPRFGQAPLAKRAQAEERGGSRHHRRGSQLTAPRATPSGAAGARWLLGERERQHRARDPADRAESEPGKRARSRWLLGERERAEYIKE